MHHAAHHNAAPHHHASANHPPESNAANKDGGQKLPPTLDHVTPGLFDEHSHHPDNLNPLKTPNASAAAKLNHLAPPTPIGSGVHHLQQSQGSVPVKETYKILKNHFSYSIDLKTTPFVSKIESHEAKANEMRKKQPAYDYGKVAPADVHPARERLKEAVADKDGNVYDGEVYLLHYLSYLHIYSKQGTNVREGRGILVKKDGAIYEGWFRNNKFHGRGRVISAQGDMYDGELRDGKEYGHGTFIWADGSKYVGEMKDGERNGHGIYEWPDGEKYEGGFVNSKREGKGAFY